MRKKVGLITSEESFLSNFGAALQGYALYRTIKNLGYDCKIIRYDSIKPESIDNKYISYKNKDILKAIRRRLLRILYLKANKRRLANKQLLFKKFQDENMEFLSEERFTYETIKSKHLDFYAYVCGSDQIWNPYYRGQRNDRGYFLGFGNKDAIRIAYAPSIGKSIIPDNCKDEMKSLISNLDYISVREKQGANVISELIGREVPVHIDPTMLISPNEWIELSKSTFQDEEYILLYRFVGRHYIDDAVRYLSKTLGLKVITLSMYHNENDRGFERALEVGPNEFLSLVKNAKIVCTESFHATVFSILFNTPFLAFPRDEETKELSSDTRIIDLLNATNLSERYIYSGHKLQIEEILDIDYSLAHEYISNCKEKSMNYLKNALGGKTDEN